MSVDKKLKIKIFADGADLAGIKEMYGKSYIKGFTTNPTLMRKAGIQNYEEFCRSVLVEIPDRPISLEVFSDDIDDMVRQARKLSEWGPNVYVKIPVTNTQGTPTTKIIQELSASAVKLNVTAIMTLDQVRCVAEALSEKTPSVISVFAGRIADTGRDPLPLMQEALRIIESKPVTELLWASPREILNIVQADEMGCHIITVTNDLLKKLSGVGMSLPEMSLNTVKMFYEDAKAAGYQL